MTVTLSQDTYDAMLEDIKKLRERNKDLEDWFNIDDCIDFAKNEHNRQEDETLNIALRKLIKKAQAFDEIDDLIVNGTLKDREPNAIFQNICHVIINLKERCRDVEI